MTLSGVVKPCTPTPELLPLWPPTLISITYDFYTMDEDEGMTCAFHGNVPQLLILKLLCPKELLIFVLGFVGLFYTAVKIPVEVFRVVTPCSVAAGYRRFGGVATQKTCT
jgi:hypothetical protein